MKPNENRDFTNRTEPRFEFFHLFPVTIANLAIWS